MTKILCCFLFSFLFAGMVSAQMKGYSILRDESDESAYLILQAQVDPYSCFSGKSMRGLYSLVDGELRLDSILGEDEFGKDEECYAFEVGKKIDFTGNLVVSRLEFNEKQFTKILGKGGVEIDNYTSDITMISFENGVNKNEYCVGRESSYCNSYAGQLFLNLWGESHSVKILHDGQVIYDLTELEIFGEYVLILPAGKYQIQEVTYEGEIILKEFQLDAEQRYFYDGANYGYNYDETYNFGTSLNYSGYVGMDFLYTNANLISLSDNEASKSFHLGFKGGADMFSSKIGMSKLAITYGFDYDYVNLDNEFDSIADKEVKRTAYVGIYYTTDVFFRQYFSLPIADRYVRPCLDLGVSYKLPLYFRKNTVTDGFKYSERWLHLYNELIVYSRIGMSNGFALNVSYRPFNSIKNGLPELPKLQFGLTIMLDVY
ncbi:hypothetical protein [Parvicella tangerina]|uniref:Uncharacterized protein n=1 Tax=Parvicella tangerina TaxID=2829795 RepID=A0A916NQP4_9FLAO|nr:hypothetical protein [Parvicella tangerina]CAG5079620.1 hypothetical protein CRYO30217_00990 [Parvicella tangerina]